MTEHLQRVAEPTDDDSHYQRVCAGFQDAKIICDDSESIGLVKLSRTTSEWHLHQIQVLPDRQRKGIGTHVLNEVLIRAGREGVSVTLSVLHGNPARNLYERLGFRVVSETSTNAKLTWHHLF